MVRDCLTRLIAQLVVGALLAAQPAAGTRTRPMQQRGQIVLMLHAGAPGLLSQLVLRVLR